MRIEFTPEQEAALKEVAAEMGTDAERLVREAALTLLEQDKQFRAAVREGIAQADRGEFIEEAGMNARLEKMLKSWIIFRWTPATAADLESINSYLKDRHPQYREPTIRRLYEGESKTRENSCCLHCRM